MTKEQWEHLGTRATCPHAYDVRKYVENCKF